MGSAPACTRDRAISLGYITDGCYACIAPLHSIARDASRRSIGNVMIIVMMILRVSMRSPIERSSVQMATLQSICQHINKSTLRAG